MILKKLKKISCVVELFILIPSLTLSLIPIPFHPHPLSLTPSLSLPSSFLPLHSYHSLSVLPQKGIYQPPFYIGEKC